MNCKIEAAGIVQGVGFRPFVARLAREMKIEGTVCNAGSSVFIEARGTEQSIRLLPVDCGRKRLPELWCRKSE